VSRLRPDTRDTAHRRCTIPAMKEMQGCRQTNVNSVYFNLNLIYRVNTNLTHMYHK
jgi:hypothetical protein